MPVDDITDQIQTYTFHNPPPNYTYDPKDYKLSDLSKYIENKETTNIIVTMDDKKLQQFKMLTDPRPNLIFADDKEGLKTAATQQ